MARQPTQKMVLLAAEALTALGLSRLSFDLTLPTLAPALLDDAGLQGPGRTALVRALDRKDAAGVTRHGGPIADLLSALLLAAGPVAPALAVLDDATMGPGPAALRARLRETVDVIRARAPNLRLTLDPVEFRGFRYHTGLCLNIFALGRAEELGRGGRYVSGCEPATGLTLFPDAILRVAAPPAGRTRVFLPFAAPPAQGARLREEGYATIPALDAAADPTTEATRLGCTHILHGGAAVPLNAEH